MTVPAGTKSETLERLAPVVRGAKVLPQVRVTADTWTKMRAATLSSLKDLGWLETPLIVRSSALHEDQDSASNAGRFKSIPAVVGQSAVIAAVDAVFASYGDLPAADDQVFIQPFLTDVSVAGVAFTREPSSGSPYIVINYDLSGDTAAVASGTARRSETYYFWKHGADLPSGFLGDVIRLLRELEELLGRDALDIEFAVSASHGLCLLQARPLFVAPETIDVERHREILSGIARRIETAARVHPYLHGKRTVFGVMPDWNPAEIIGVRPRPLALSLYRRLVTDQIWAYQRSNYGYKNLRSFPLMLSFHGMPYIDVRVSFNSFIPADVDDKLADRLADHYVERLVSSPALHDKIEFEIVHSCYALDLPTHLARLTDAGIGRGDVAALSHSLRRLTNRVIHDQRGIWRQDLARLEEFELRRTQILSADMGEVDRIYWLLEDCKRWGTLPFAGLARAGFIAMQMLRSMVAVGVLSEAQMAAFLANVDTVTSRMMADLAVLDRADFLAQYGHLRPGTYDILSARYDETPERYLGAPQPRKSDAAPAPIPFALSAAQAAELTDLLKVHGLDIGLDALFDFMRAVIQGRERAKFLFTRSLSDSLSLLKKLGINSGFDTDDMSHVDISVIEELYASSADPKEILRASIAAGRARYAETCSIVLPALISDPKSVWAFHLPPNEANFITQRTAEGPVVGCETGADDFKDAIIFIPNADPGFDWIFTKGISGFVTAYGGVNSHMAIRAQELRMPAVIGAGEVGLVRGYRGNLFDNAGVALFDNPRWAESNMVVSLQCAAPWLRTAPCIVSYSDIFYSGATVARLAGCTDDIAIAFDPAWRQLWERRFTDPLADAETFRIDDNGIVTEIGKKTANIADIQGQYMGLLRFTPAGWAVVEAFLAAQTSAVRDRLDMTSLLSGLILGGTRVRAVPVVGLWGEVDNAADLKVYEDMVQDGIFTFT